MMTRNMDTGERCYLYVFLHSAFHDECFKKLGVGDASYMYLCY